MPTKTLTTPPRQGFKTLDEAYKYIVDLHRALETNAAQGPANRESFQLGTFTDDYDMTTALTTAELQVIVQTLINSLKDYGIVNAKRS